MNLNKIFILGNVTRDPEVRALPSGQQVTSFGMATNRFYTSGTGEKKQEAEFHNVVCFGKLADISSRYLNKGSLVLIEGRIKTRNWTNPQGVKQYRTEIIAETMQLGPKGAGSTAGSGNSNYGKSNFSRPEPEPEQSSLSQEIPVIEENYTPPADDGSTDTKSVSFEDNAADEIDVKDIPF
ncbi:MAG: single-stranded DNA-binding protein [Candidatus Staskawiczbacteria bacterium]|nr:single-stranded DNA-binding protein [Candidatus Staskawiczbacteria bacterium]